MHQPHQIAALRTLATRFRSAICATDPAEVDPEVRFIVAAFPENVCGEICFLLGHYLRENGFPAAEYVNGIRLSDGRSHAWIETDGIIVDITSDQFAEIADEVVVTRDTTWHRQFCDRPGRRPADFLIYGADTPHGLAYEPIARHLPRA
ncbi:MAG: hypothetical protein WDO73_18050 [Ignavibacteriota bacterium]